LSYPIEQLLMTWNRAPTPSVSTKSARRIVRDHRRMRTRAASLTFALALGLALCGQVNAAPQRVETATRDVLIIHDSLPGTLPPGIVVGNNILDLLGHFGLSGTLMPIERYRAGDLAQHRCAIVVGVDQRAVAYPAALLGDVRGGSRPVFWIAGHLAELVRDPDFAAKIGFRLGGTAMLTGFESVAYKGQSLLKGEPSLFPLEILDPSKTRVLATAMRKNGTAKPYILHSGSFWYCADSPFAFAEEGDRYLVFCDLLHDFLGIQHHEGHQALVRIEDVSIDSDPQELRALADLLYDKRIPFQVSLIPIFKDPTAKEEIYLSDRPQIVRALRYMVTRGGTVVMHGVTHQYRGTSADDYEFWDEQSGKPAAGDSPPLIAEKLRLGLGECFRNGLYPLTWETPHYVASERAYRTFARYFSSSYERLSAVDNAEAGYYCPYTTVDRYGRFIIPENLGFIDVEDPRPEELLRHAARMQVVRDGVASFYFHPFVGLNYLEQLTAGIAKLGYEFISIRNYPLRVQMDERLVQDYTRGVELTIQARYAHRLVQGADGSQAEDAYAERPRRGPFRDAGIVPSGALLIVEGVNDTAAPREPPPPGLWERLRAWVGTGLRRRAPMTPTLEQPQAVVLWDENLPRDDWNNQASYVSALSVYGFSVSRSTPQTLNAGALPLGTILVVPRAIALKLPPAKVRSVRDFVGRGGRLVLEGESPLAQSLGIRSEGRSLKVRTVDELVYGTEAMVWNPAADVTRFSLPNAAAVYARDQVSELPVATLGVLERGRFLYLGARLDPQSRLGYARYPYFVHYLRDAFQVNLPAQRGQLELYFDPALSKRQGAEDRLAEQWRKLGVRAIYVAAYQFWPKWSYNYQHLVDVCHKNGILVYAWFELPHVSVKFWEEHPQWRAKTATGADGHVGWRYHMDLDIPECRAAAFDFVGGLLQQYDWDGVTIAELNYDTLNGPETPQAYLPMGMATRTAFVAEQHFDPLQLFSPSSPHYWRSNPGALRKFEDYRAQRVLEWHRALLDRVTPIANARGMEIIVTMLDSLHSPTLRRDTGVDSPLIVSLMDRYPFTLQVEDPAHAWADPPDRYYAFAETYRKLVPDRKRLMFDINVVPDRNVAKSLAPTRTAMGIELAQTLVAARRACGRAAIYGEGTIPFQDLEVLSRVLAHDAHVQGRTGSWTVEADEALLVNAPGPWQRHRVDGRVWPGWGEGSVLIPAGAHRITTSASRFQLVDRSALDIRLLRFSGDLETLTPTGEGFALSYDSRQRALALLNREPHAVRVDGQPYALQPVGYFGQWSIRLPSGRHTLEIVADSTATVILNTTSLYSSTAIVALGLVTCGLSGLLYMSILVRRVFGRRRRARL
jgi:uncharacterized protein YdaL